MSDVQTEYRRKNSNFFRKWGAVLILIAFFLASWTGQFTNQLIAYKQDAKEHHQEFQMSEFWPEFWSSTFENWQSEWLQLFTQALLIAAFSDYLFRKGNEEQYKTQMMIEELRKEIKGSKK